MKTYLNSFIPSIALAPAFGLKEGTWKVFGSDDRTTTQAKDRALNGAQYLAAHTLFRG